MDLLKSAVFVAVMVKKIGLDMSNERWSYSCGDAMAMVFFRSDAIPMF